MLNSSNYSCSKQKQEKITGHNPKPGPNAQEIFRQVLDCNKSADTYKNIDPAGVAKQKGNMKLLSDITAP